MNDLVNENKKTAEKTEEFLVDAMSGNLEEGNYTWNGSNWVKK